MWIYNNKELIEDEITPGSIGFVYLITNLTNNRIYVGKKLLTMAGVRPKKIVIDGKAKRRATVARKKSNYESYYGSCKDLTIDVKLIGKDKFKREILLFCNSKSTLSYFEGKYQMKYEVLESDNSYNSCITLTSYKKNIKQK